MFGYLITAFAGVFWFFRLIVALMDTMELTFPIVPMNITFEIILLFITFICIVLIAKRKMTGALIYLIAQCAYFGVDAYKSIQSIVNGQTADYTTLFISIVAVLIPVLAIMNITLNTGNKKSTKNKKTEWFYGTTEYDRNIDERADKNQYKF